MAKTFSLNLNDKADCSKVALLITNQVKNLLQKLDTGFRGRGCATVMLENGSTSQHAWKKKFDCETLEYRAHVSQGQKYVERTGVPQAEDYEIMYMYKDGIPLKTPSDELIPIIKRVSEIIADNIAKQEDEYYIKLKDFGTVFLGVRRDIEVLPSEKDPGKSLGFVTFELVETLAVKN